MDVVDDDEVPPLEDMSELLAAAKGSKLDGLDDHRGTEHKKTLDNSTFETSVQDTDESFKGLKLTETKLNHEKGSTTTREKISESRKQNTSFGGFKKGFLLSKTDKRQSQAAKPVAACKDEAPIIRARDPQAASNKHQIKEVQEAMKAGAPLLENKDWITDDLLKKLESNPALMNELADPKFSAVLQQLKSDPAQAEQTLSSNPKLRTLVQDFCALLGDHFLALGDKQETLAKPHKDETSFGLTEVSSTKTSNKPQESELDAKAKAALNDPCIVEMLKDPWVQELLRNLRSDPTKAQYLLKMASPEQQGKIRKLVDAGLLAPA